MKDAVLEFRGINLDHLGMYFEELGAIRKTEGPISIKEALPVLYEADGWSSEILSDEEIAFTSIFKINAVKIRFYAESDEALAGLIKNYRYKTTRIGG